MRVAQSSSYFIVKNNSEAIGESQNIISASNREQLGLMLMSTNELLCKVIEQMLSDKTKPRERLTVSLSSRPDSTDDAKPTGG